MATTAAPTAPPAPSLLLPLPDAAARLGLSQSALRRRLRAGTARGERRPTASGFAWYVAVDEGPDGLTPTPERTPERAAPSGERETPSPPPTPERTPTRPEVHHEGAPGVPETALLATRAQEMAQYTRELLAPLHTRLEAQAERIGRLEAELAAATARLAEVDPPVPQNGSAPAPEQGERRWWQRLLWG